MKNYKKALMGSVALVFALSGCESKIDSASGAAVDGYLSGATVCLDINSDGACGSNEPKATTDTNGNYTLDTSAITTEDQAGAKLIVSGGTDIATDASFDGVLMAPFTANEDGSYTLSPLTTLVAQNASSNLAEDIVASQKEIAKALGFDEANYADLGKDPIALASSDSTKVKVYEAALAIQKSMELMVAGELDADSTKTKAEVTAQISKALAVSFSGGAGDNESTLDAKINAVLDDVVAKNTDLKAATKTVAAAKALNQQIHSDYDSLSGTINKDTLASKQKIAETHKEEFKAIVTDDAVTSVTFTYNADGTVSIVKKDHSGVEHSETLATNSDGTVQKTDENNTTTTVSE